MYLVHHNCHCCKELMSLFIRPEKKHTLIFVQNAVYGDPQHKCFSFRNIVKYEHEPFSPSSVWISNKWTQPAFARALVTHSCCYGGNYPVLTPPQLWTKTGLVVVGCYNSPWDLEWSWSRLGTALPWCCLNSPRSKYIPVLVMTLSRLVGSWLPHTLYL